MADWDRDDDDAYLSGPATASLPLSTQSTPAAPTMARRSITPPPRGPPSPPPRHSDRKERRHSKRASRDSKRTSRDISTDDSVSILDPRRFTPTLHANLVSEILSLRRDQEDKTKLIESLEVTLSTSREEQEEAVRSYGATAKENRSLKRQLALLEGGTSSALGELARERDEAVEASADTKKRLDAATKKIRVQEDDSQRVHEQWARERDDWDEERRRFERRLHVAESRLKVVLDEVAALHASEAQQDQNADESDEANESGRENNANDAGSVRSMSISNSVRFSHHAAHRGSIISTRHLPGATLADELNLDDDDTDWDGRESVVSGHSRNFSRDSISASPKKSHVSKRSVDSIKRPASMARGRLFMNPAVLEALEGEDEEDSIKEPARPKPTYTDTGVQYTPPPSPVQAAADPEPEAEAAVVPPMKLADDSAADSSSPSAEVEANQRRKRVQLTPSSSTQTVPEPPAAPVSCMVSSSSQTVDEPISPPSTRPQTPEEQLPPPPPPAIMVTSSTQTEQQPEPEHDSSTDDSFEESFMDAAPSPPRTHLVPSPSPPPIPSISIQPPTSRPTTPREPRLPPLSKHFGCQVSLGPSGAPTSDASVQTEGIQVDKRIAMLPAHLQPSSITSRPSSPSGGAAPAGADLDKRFNTVVPAPPRNPRRLAKAATVTPAADKHQQPPVSPSLPPPPPPASRPYADEEEDELRDSYPGNNDNGPLSDDNRAGGPKRPHRFSSLFAGFDTASSDEGEFGDEDNSDSEFRTALSAPRPQSVASRAGARSPTDSVTVASPTSTDHASPRQAATAGSSRAGAGSTSSQADRMRKAAVIQSGMASHIAGGRSRSPSLPEPSFAAAAAATTKYPPFPIPTRASSRKPNISAPPSDLGSGSGRRSPTRFDNWGRRNGRSHVYHRPSTSNSLRKTRSAAALPRNQGQGGGYGYAQPQGQWRYRSSRQGSRSPPPLSPSTEAPESPGLPPLPRGGRPRRGNSHYRRHRPRASNTTDRTSVTNVTTGTYATNLTAGTYATNVTDPVSVASGATTTSNGASAGAQTSVVDAISQCMVGEWMFKYVRRRKSFNVPGSEPAGGRDDTGNGNDRHRRWVWLAPYERAILWSSKQPSTGSALMGKTGRKLMIQSVLDVKDDNVAPKGQPPGSVFNRSVLILTPERALKFTATSAERHYVWLTALSFLAHSSQAVPDIINSPQPPHMQLQPPQEQQHQMTMTSMDDGAPAPSLPKANKRGGIRDSIRLAKGRGGGGAIAGGPPPMPTVPSASAVPSMPTVPTSYSAGANVSGSGAAAEYTPLGAITTSHTRDQSNDTAAEPPMVPRFQERANQAMVHGRKRSNTGGHVPPPLSFRGFSGPAPSSSVTSSGHRANGSTAGNSVNTAGSSDYYYYPQHAGGSSQYSSSGVPGGGSSQASASQRTSEASSSRPANFFDAIGTVRMEAFISPLGPREDQEDAASMPRAVAARRRSKELRRRQSRRSGSRTRDSGSYYSYGSRARTGSTAATGEEDYFRDDPFRGF